MSARRAWRTARRHLRPGSARVQLSRRCVLHHPDDDPPGGFGLPKPHGLSDFVEGLARWHNRVIGYAVTLVTDSYPRSGLRPELGL